jgi:hypothetical protein
LDKLMLSFKEIEDEVSTDTTDVDIVEEQQTEE